MSDLERWISAAFRRQGSNLVVGPTRDAVSLCREDIDVMLDNLAAIQGRLPTLAQRLEGLSTCEACDGEGVVHDVDRDLSGDCPACDGEGFGPREGEDF